MGRGSPALHQYIVGRAAVPAVDARAFAPAPPIRILLRNAIAHHTALFLFSESLSRDGRGYGEGP